MMLLIYWLVGQFVVLSWWYCIECDCVVDLESVVFTLFAAINFDIAFSDSHIDIFESNERVEFKIFSEKFIVPLVVFVGCYYHWR